MRKTALVLVLAIAASVGFVETGISSDSGNSGANPGAFPPAPPTFRAPPPSPPAAGPPAPFFPPAEVWSGIAQGVVSGMIGMIEVTIFGLPPPPPEPPVGGKRG